MKERHGLAELVGELVAIVLGWAICMAMLGSAYLLGYTLAQHFGGAEHRDAFGLLSAITLIWLYEHRRADERWGRFFNRERHHAE